MALETVLDIFENYVKWVKANPQHKYDTYKIWKTKETPETIKWQMLLLYRQKFRYHGEYRCGKV